MHWGGIRTHAAGTSWQRDAWGTRGQGLPPQWPPGIERGNNLEAPLTTLGTLLHVGAREALHQGMGRLQGTRPGRWDVEHTTAGGQGLGTAPIAEQAVMAQALEAAGEHMEQLCGEVNYVARRTQMSDLLRS